MAKVTEAEFAKICDDIHRDRASIIEHNPVGTEDEILLWMLLSVLISYLSLNELETPCFNGTPNTKTYRDAIDFVLQDRRVDEFDAGKYIAELTKQ